LWQANELPKFLQCFALHYLLLSIPAEDLLDILLGLVCLYDLFWHGAHLRCSNGSSKTLSCCVQSVRYGGNLWQRDHAVNLVQLQKQAQQLCAAMVHDTDTKLCCMYLVHSEWRQLAALYPLQ